ncbi:helicase associated domain-containing protein [Streptomyces anulatus]|uniref:helicase associated domain-containing protein n=1 Tax=Streptomyces anulatus TaxID=1892 RepID=UPI0034158E17
MNGCDVGTWTTRQTDPTVWDTLLPEQREGLTALGLTPRTAAPATTTAGKNARGTRAAGKGAGAFERGITALTQYAAREGRVVVPRTHVEETPHGPVRLGTWISNTRTRRDRLSSESATPAPAATASAASRGSSSPRSASTGRRRPDPPGGGARRR